jgi:hypothetical protein
MSGCQWCGNDFCNGLWVDCPEGLGETLPVVIGIAEPQFLSDTTDDLPMLDDADFQTCNDEWDGRVHFWSSINNPKENRMVTVVFDTPKKNSNHEKNLR